MVAALRGAAGGAAGGMAGSTAPSEAAWLAAHPATQTTVGGSSTVSLTVASVAAAAPPHAAGGSSCRSVVYKASASPAHNVRRPDGSWWLSLEVTLTLPAAEWQRGKQVLVDYTRQADWSSAGSDLFGAGTLEEAYRAYYGPAYRSGFSLDGRHRAAASQPQAS